MNDWLVNGSPRNGNHLMFRKDVIHPKKLRYITSNLFINLNLLIKIGCLFILNFRRKVACSCGNTDILYVKKRANKLFKNDLVMNNEKYSKKMKFRINK